MAISNLFSLMQMANTSRVMGPQDAPQDYRTFENVHADFNAQAPWLTSAHDISLGGRIQVLQAHDKIHEALQGVVGGGDAAPPSPGEPPPHHEEAPIPAGAQSPGPSQAGDAGPAPTGGLAGAGADALGSLPSPSEAQIEGDHVRVVSNQVQQPLVHVNEQGRLEGDRGVIESYATADRVYESQSRALGRDFTFVGGDKLTVSLNDPQAEVAGPNSPNLRASVQLPSGAAFSPNDPDVVAHETGHAILDSQRPELNRGAHGSAVHEAYADTTAMLESLRDPEVRRDVITQTAAGKSSNLASNVGEGYQQVIHAEDEEAKKHPPMPASAQSDAPAGGAATDKDAPPPATFERPEVPVWKRPETEVKPMGGDPRAGLRDLSQAPPKEPDKPFEDGHEASRKFSSAAYNSVMDVSKALRAADPSLSEDEALKRAGERVNGDFVRTLDFLPVGADTTQSDLARAMIKADRVDQEGQFTDIYKRNFEAAGLQPTTVASTLQDAGLQALGQNAALKLPTGLQQADAFKINPPPPPATPAVPSQVALEVAGFPAAATAQPRSPLTPAQTQAAQYLQDHADALGVSKSVDWQAQELVHNNRGETFLYYSNGANRYDVSANQFLALGFDRDGCLMHVSQGEVKGPALPFPVGPAPEQGPSGL